MGSRCRWIAVGSDQRDTTLATLGLSLGERSDEPIYDTGLYGVALDSGWFVVFADGGDEMERLSEDDARELSAAGKVLFFYCDDTPMATRMVDLEQGAETWSMTHDGSTGEHEMLVTGTPPARALSLLAEATAAQKAQDPNGEYPVDHIYDITAAFGREYIGFRHDETLSEDEFPATWELEEASGREVAPDQAGAGTIGRFLNRLRGRKG